MNREARSGPLDVVLVEDDSVTRLSLALAIEAEPALRLVAALDGVGRALAWLEERGADLLLTDLRLPDGSGLDIIRACFRIRPDCAIMVITMSSDEDSVLASIAAGASGYMLKDSGRLDIAHALLELHAGGSPISPFIARKVLARLRAPEPEAAPPSDRSMARWARFEPPAPRETSVLESLTPREASILELIAQGASYANIAQSLSVGIGTVQSYVKSLYGKLAVHSRGAAVFEAQKRGLLRMGKVLARK
ncbi:MAG: response regulator [Noviherbaspirillum sp.]